MQMPILQMEMFYMTSLPWLGDREVSCGEGSLSHTGTSHLL